MCGTLTGCGGDSDAGESSISAADSLTEEESVFYDGLVEISSNLLVPESIKLRSAGYFATKAGNDFEVVTITAENKMGGTTDSGYYNDHGEWKKYDEEDLSDFYVPKEHDVALDDASVQNISNALEEYIEEKYE